jgi:hypothetical protein
MAPTATTPASFSSKSRYGLSGSATGCIGTINSTIAACTISGSRRL